MVAVVGTYQNGYVKLDKDYSTKKNVKVIITFSESQKNLENFKGSFSDTVIEERRDVFIDITQNAS